MDPFIAFRMDSKFGRKRIRKIVSQRSANRPRIWARRRDSELNARRVESVAFEWLQIIEMSEDKDLIPLTLATGMADFGRVTVLGDVSRPLESVSRYRPALGCAKSVLVNLLNVKCGILNFVIVEA